MTDALEIEITAPVVSFRDPLYSGVQVGLPCPPPSTVAGVLASAAGGWHRMPVATRFAMAFSARGGGVDLETYHPLDARGTKTDPTPKDREFLAEAQLHVWLLEDLDLWEQSFRRPVWPLRFGRSQDLASARTRRLVLEAGPGRQGYALVPADVATAGKRMRLPNAISEDRARTRWESYRYAATGNEDEIPSRLRTPGGQAVVLLPPCHPDQFLVGAS